MGKLENIAIAFTNLNMKIITDLQSRGYTHADAETLACIRQNLESLKAMKINIDGEVVKG